MNQNFYNSNSSCFDQSQPPQSPVIYPPPQETSIETLHDQENEIDSVQTFLRKFNRISFFEMPKVLLLAWDKIFKIKDAFGNKQYKPEDILELFRDLFNDVKNIREELAEYINTPGWNRHAFYNSDNDDDEDCTITITSDFLITDSLSMGDEHFNTIPEKESDEFIKSCVETLVPIPSEFEDFSDNKSECDIPDCDDSQTTHFSTFSNPLFDDCTSSDDESSHEEDIHEMSFKSYSNLLFDLDEEIISNEFNPIHNEDLDSTPKMIVLIPSLIFLNYYSIVMNQYPPGIDCNNSDSEGDTLSRERLLHDDPIPLSDTLDFDFSNVVRVFLPFFTYLVTSAILLSSGSEDTIFYPGISNYHFSSLETGVSHRSRTFMKFNVYPNHLNESPMMIHGKNIPILDLSSIPGNMKTLAKVFCTQVFISSASIGNHRYMVFHLVDDVHASGVYGDEHFNTIPEKESNEFIKSCVETLVPIPSEFEYFSDIESECDIPDCDDSQTTHFSTFSNPLFDDSTSSDDESSHEEDIHKMSFKTYSNLLFDLDEEIISSEFNPIHNEDLDSTPKNDGFDTKSYLLESLLNRDESIPPGIDCDNSDSEGDTLSLERLLHDDPIPLPDTLDFDFSNVIQVFLPFFTYPVTSAILLSSGSEDTIFDPGISNYHFSSLEPGVSHRS
nr:hypothetical protein [Tanacetum cinerariifolium]